MRVRFPPPATSPAAFFISRSHALRGNARRAEPHAAPGGISSLTELPKNTGSRLLKNGDWLRAPTLPPFARGGKGGSGEPVQTQHLQSTSACPRFSTVNNASTAAHCAF